MNALMNEYDETSLVDCGLYHVEDEHGGDGTDILKIVFRADSHLQFQQETEL